MPDVQETQPTAVASAPAGARATTGAAHVPLCFLVDEESSIRHFLSLVLHGSGVDTAEFPDGASMRKAIGGQAPHVVFLNVSLDSSEAIESVIALGKAGYRGAVQLMSNRGAAVLDHVKSIGLQHKLNMLPVLKKPFETEAVIKILTTLKLGILPAPGEASMALSDALAKNAIEFWYQPKIDLRKKQLAGVEAFARARHPEHGIILPSAFMKDAAEGDIVKLAELGVTAALKAGLAFAKLGIHLRIAINIPVQALVKLPVAELVRAHRREGEKWPGLIIDVTEQQIISDLAVATELTKKFEPYNVRLAVDDFGKAYAALTRIKELPFAELKLDRVFVTDCGSDKVNAPLCKTVIDLAHSFGSVAVAVGIEKASDAVALVSMGCDYGQGFLLGQPMPEERFLSLLRQRAGSVAVKTVEKVKEPAPA